jgi:hypothetical protein
VSFQQPRNSVIIVSTRVRGIGSACLGALALLGTASSAVAQTPQASTVQPPAPVLGEPTPTVLSAPPADVNDGSQSLDDTKQPRMFGAMFDLGVPDGTTLSFVYRPIDLARLHAGLGYNGVSPGLRIGGEFLPLGWGPSLGIAYGYYFEGDANGLAGMFGDTSEGSELLENVGYDYFALRAGMEFGGDRFTFFARGGFCWLSTTLHQLDSVIASDDPNSNTTVSVREDPVLNAVLPTLQFGMIVQI